MVTKIKTLRDATHFASRFEYNPDNTSGLNFGYLAGSVVKTDGEIHEFPAGQVAVAGNSTLQLYVDMAAATPTLNLETVITSGNYVLLYQISTSGTEIVSIEDRRSWTAAAIGDDLLTGGGATDPLTAFETEVATYSPSLVYRFNESGREDDLLNSGSAGASWDLPLNGVVNDEYLRLWNRVAGGDVNTSFALNVGSWVPGGTSQLGFRVTPTDWGIFTGAGTGTFVWVVAMGFDSRSANDNFLRIHNQDNPGDSAFNISMFNDDLDIDFFSEGAGGDWQVRGVAINQDVFPTYTMFALVQPGDGGGPLLYKDGVDIGVYTGVGPGEEDLWFDAWTTEALLPTELLMGCGYASASTVQANLNGNFEYFAYTQTPLTSTNVSDLWTAYSVA